MGLITPTANGLTRTWELASTPITATGVSDVAEGGIGHFLGTIYIITSGAVSMTIDVEESPDNVNWVQVSSEPITQNEAYRIVQPFPYLRINATIVAGQIDSIKMIGLIQ